MAGHDGAIAGAGLGHGFAANRNRMLTTRMKGTARWRLENGGNLAGERYLDALCDWLRQRHG